MIATRKVFIVIWLIILFFLNENAFALFSSHDTKETRFSCWRIFHRTASRGHLNIPSNTLRRLPPPTKFVYNLPCMDTVYVSGNISLTIIGNQPKNKLVVRNTYDGRNADIKFYEGSLYIGNISRSSANSPRRNVEVILYTSNLRRLFISGNNRVCGRDIAECCGLELTTCGSGSVCLTGPTHLKRIMNTGNTVIDVNQLDTDHLHIVSTCAGKITLAGRAGLLLIRAFGCTTTDARCVCAHTGFIQSGNNAFVMVRITGSLRAFAANSSNIYYFTTPMDIVTHNTGSSNILQYANW